MRSSRRSSSPSMRSRLSSSSRSQRWRTGSFNQVQLSRITWCRMSWCIASSCSVMPAVVCAARFVAGAGLAHAFGRAAAHGLAGQRFAATLEVIDLGFRVRLRQPVGALQLAQQLFAPARNACHLLVAELAPALLHAFSKGFKIVSCLVQVHVLAALLLRIDALFHRDFRHMSL